MSLSSGLPYALAFIGPGPCRTYHFDPAGQGEFHQGGENQRVGRPAARAISSMATGAVEIRPNTAARVAPPSLSACSSKS